MSSNAHEGDLLINALGWGYLSEEIEERVVDAAEYQAALAEDPVEIAMLAAIEAEKIKNAAKVQAYIDNLPSWNAVETTINNVSSLTEAKVVLLKLARVVYWLAKDSEI